MTLLSALLTNALFTLRPPRPLWFKIKLAAAALDYILTRGDGEDTGVRFNIVRLLLKIVPVTNDLGVQGKHG